VSNSFPYFSNQHSTSINPLYVHFYAPLDPDGCVREPEGRLLYRIPPDRRTMKGAIKNWVMRTRFVAQGHKGTNASCLRQRQVERNRRIEDMSYIASPKERHWSGGALSML